MPVLRSVVLAAPRNATVERAVGDAPAPRNVGDDEEGCPVRRLAERPAEPASSLRALASAR